MPEVSEPTSPLPAEPAVPLLGADNDQPDDRSPTTEQLQSAAPLPERIWEQWPGESDHWYACFLIYLAMGNGRSLNAAYMASYSNRIIAEARLNNEPSPTEIVLPEKMSGKWQRVASRFHWEERAARYDVFTLSQLVPQTVQTIFAVITEFAKVTLEQLQARQTTPESWPELQSAVETLANYISPEIIKETVSHATRYPGLAGLPDESAGEPGNDELDDDE